MTATGLGIEDFSCAVGMRTLFEHLEHRLPAGGWTMLTGPNGSGKTTLMRAVAGLVRPLQGTLRWNGAGVNAGDPAWRGRIVYVGHGAGAKAELSTRENLSLQLALDVRGGVDDAHIDSALERAGLKRQRSLAFGRLSAGQRRRLSLARLMCIDRGLWLLDEPATALDEQGLVLLCSMLDAHLEQGGCAMVATHQALATRHPAQPLEIARWRPMRVEAPQP